MSRIDDWAQREEQIVRKRLLGDQVKEVARYAERYGGLFWRWYHNEGKDMNKAIRNARKAEREDSERLKR